MKTGSRGKAILCLKACRRCDASFAARSGRALYCKGCLASHVRERRNTPIEKMRNATRRETLRAIKAGELVRRPCEKCGREPTHAHHDDYAKPLTVRWLCPQHHTELHWARAFLLRHSRMGHKWTPPAWIFEGAT